MRWKRLPARPTPLAEPDLVGSPELIQEQARWLKNPSPTFASAGKRWVVLGPGKAYRASGADPLLLAPKHGAWAMPRPELRVAGNRPAGQHSRLNED